MASLTGARDRRPMLPAARLRVVDDDPGHRASALQYRRTFRASLFSSFGIPVLFLTAMGLGLGGYVDQSATPTRRSRA